MILVDTREDEKTKGSPGLWSDLKKSGLPVQLSKLDAGDLMFVGNGPTGPMTVGVEFKKIRDLLSSIRTGRLAGHQLLGMQEYDFRYLLVEGEWRTDEQGLVTTRVGRAVWRPVPGHFRASELDKTLLGLTLRGGIYVWPTATRRDTVRWIQSLYRCFTDGKWEDHSSHIAIHRPASLVPLSDFRKVVTTFPGVGIKTSKAVEEYFNGSLVSAFTALVDEWEEIDGIGKKGAARIVEFLE